MEGDGLDAVRLMTIHRAKGLEFKIVCVADLGRGPRGRYPLMRIGSDGRFGLRLAQPGTARAEPALEYKALGDEQSAAEAAEERRLFYVAMTRAEDRLILSGAAKLDAWPANAAGGPIGWIGPAVVPELAALAEEREDGVAEGVAVRFFDEAGPASEPPVPLGGRSGALSPVDLTAPPAPPAAAPAAAVSELSYSSIEEHRRCGYRFYVERVLRLPGVEGPWAPGAAVVPAAPDAEAASSATGAKGGPRRGGGRGRARRGRARGRARRGGARGRAWRGGARHPDPRSARAGWISSARCCRTPRRFGLPLRSP